MKIRFSPRAQQRARHIKTWWLKNRPGIEVFEQEFDQLMDRLASMSPRSPLGVVADSMKHGKKIWRVLLPRAQQHVFYSVDEQNDTVIVRTIWGAQRGRRPKF